MEEAYLRELMKLVELTSPQLWDVGVQQAIQVGRANLIIASVGIVVTLVMVYLAVRFYRTLDSSDRDPAVTFAAFVALIMLLVTVSSLNAGLKHIANPDYYALEELLKMVLECK